MRTERTTSDGKCGLLWRRPPRLGGPPGQTLCWGSALEGRRWSREACPPARWRAEPAWICASARGQQCGLLLPLMCVEVVYCFSFPTPRRWSSSCDCSPDCWSAAGFKSSEPATHQYMHEFFFLKRQRRRTGSPFVSWSEEGFQSYVRILFVEPKTTSWLFSLLDTDRSK